MLNRKILMAGISVFMIGISTSSTATEQTNTAHVAKHKVRPVSSLTHHKKSLSDKRHTGKIHHYRRPKIKAKHKQASTRLLRKKTRKSQLRRHRVSVAKPMKPIYIMAQSGGSGKPLMMASIKPSQKTTSNASTSSNLQPAYVTAKPTTASEGVRATRMQPSTSSTTPPQKTSSALGIGPKSRIHINGFLSAGGSATNTSANYTVPNHGTIDSNFNFASNSLIGLQFTADLAKHLQIVTQFVADGDDTNGNVAYRVNAEWAFLRYTVTPGYQVRVGRFRIPAFLYSETEQVGYSYPFFQLPNEVYRLVPFDNVNGVDMIYRYTIGQTGWTLMIQPYYGANTNTYTIYNAAVPNGINVNFTEEDVKGVVAGVSSQSFELRGTYVDLRLTGEIPGGATLFSSDKTDFYSVGAKWTPGDFMLIAEYADRDTPSQVASLQAYYGSVGWRFGKFVPLFTYARLKTTHADRLLIAPLTSELAQDQQSYTLGFDYTFNSNLDLKASISQITPLNGTFGLFNTSPGKRHVWLYGASINAIF